MSSAEIQATEAPRACPADAFPAVKLHRDITSVAERWRVLERTAAGSSFASLPCVEAWFRHLGRDATPLIAVDARTPAARWILPLAVRRVGPLVIAEPPGGTHANHTAGLIDATGLPSGRDLAREITAALQADRHGIDLVRLPYQPPTVGGIPNPFIGPDARPAPHAAYRVDLDGGFEAVLGRHRGGKKRKRLRANARFFEPLGGYTTRRAVNAADAVAILDAFLFQKAARFAALGLPDPFARPGVREFYADLAARSFTGGRQLLDCHVLEAGGVIRATFVLMPQGDTLFGLMNSFADDDFARASPGEMLTHHVVESAAMRGFRWLDLGVGDARYKRSWIDEETIMVETLIPLTLRGRAAMSVFRAERSVRAAVLARPRLHATLQRLRRASGSVEDASLD